MDSNPLNLTDPEAEAIETAEAQDLAHRLTLELSQPLTNEHRRRPPRGHADTPLFERQEELF